jgi:hypothetical protein
VNFGRRLRHPRRLALPLLITCRTKHRVIRMPPLARQSRRFTARNRPLSMQQACEPLCWKCTTAGVVTKHMGHLPSAGASDNHALNARCQALLLVIVPTACAAPRLLTVVTVVQQGELRSLLSPQLEFSEMVLMSCDNKQTNTKKWFRTIINPCRWNTMGSPRRTRLDFPKTS